MTRPAKRRPQVPCLFSAGPWENGLQESWMFLATRSAVIGGLPSAAWPWRCISSAWWFLLAGGHGLQHELKVSQTPAGADESDDSATGGPTWLPSNLTWLENDLVIDDSYIKPWICLNIYTYIYIIEIYIYNIYIYNIYIYIIYIYIYIYIYMTCVYIYICVNDISRYMTYIHMYIYIYCRMVFQKKVGVAHCHAKKDRDPELEHRPIEPCSLFHCP